MAKSRTAFKRPYKKRVYKKSKTAVKKPTGVFKKKVLSVLKSQAEDKCMVLFPDPYLINPSLATASDLKAIVPALTTGTANNQRIGDSVKGKYIQIRGHLELNSGINVQNSDGPTRVVVRLMVLSDRVNNEYASPITNPPTGFLSQLIDYGTGQNIIDGMLGGSTNVRSMYLPINRNAAIVHYDKLHYLNAPRVYNNTGLQLQGFNLEQTIKMFNIRIKCNKNLKYTDATNYPKNFAPYICACFFQMNGGSNTTAYVKLHHCVEFKYEDL